MDATNLVKVLDSKMKEGEEKKLVYGVDNPLLFTEFNISVILLFFSAFLLWGVLAGAI